MKSLGDVVHKTILSEIFKSFSIVLIIPIAFLQPFVALVTSNLNIFAISLAVRGLLFFLHAM